MPALENILVGAILVAAALLLIRHFRRQWQGKDSCCTKQSCCQCQSPEEKQQTACPAETASPHRDREPGDEDRKQGGT